ncbi:uncharacterized protein LOC125869119 [Solanum stenotomum]|uniref:uncharacterized protein LOC125869119 n=1 Tax=Solanum stenotomum TaxID=172797 RepID=UPI0020D16553|nr:uncharacterized protein LOC125869119 [Solanum stenotomum]
MRSLKLSFIYKKLDIKRFETLHSCLALCGGTSLRQVLPSRFNDSVLDNWKKEKSKTTVKESTLDPEFNLYREKGSLKNAKREIGTKKRVDDKVNYQCCVFSPDGTVEIGYNGSKRLDSRKYSTSRSTLASLHERLGDADTLVGEFDEAIDFKWN